ncbi:hypothetical protein HA402_002296 [Bradysia odoriphaga]|nr:hypothetical protein HA402_002296 [Bradysia odoriphaga]
MSVNTAHANNGVLIHSGETIILFSDNVSMEFSGQDNGLFKGTKTGKMYLTTHRMIFNSKTSQDPLQSFSFPFICLSDVEVEQPVFGANYIRGKVRAQPDGNFTGEAKFKLLFKSGGAIDFAQSALKAAYIAKKYGNNSAPPPYTPPTGAWYQAPPPAYSANPNGYYGWVPNTQAFPNPPPPNTVFMHDAPPPYPGIVPQGPTPNGYAGGPPSYGGYGAQPPAYPGVPSAGGMYPGLPNGQQNYPGSQPGYPGNQPSYPSGQPSYPSGQPSYPSGQPSYPAAQPQPGYPAAPSNFSGPQPGYPQWGNPGFQQSSTGGFSGTVVNNGPGYPNNAGGSGPSAPSYSKEEEANQSVNYNERMMAQQNNGGFAPPPDMNELPPSYNSLNKKQN